MKSVAALLLALCFCATAIVSPAAQAAAAATELSEVHLRSLREQATADRPTVAAAVDAAPADTKNDANRAKHRVYDPVTGLYCDLIGDCHVCPASEKDEVYCRESGHRQELSCFKADSIDANAANTVKEQRFTTCTPVEKAHPVLRVITFEIIMAGLLAGAFTLLQRERRKHLSAFDLRKDPRQRSTLLGEKNAD